jgi:hypothetical protein
MPRRGVIGREARQKWGGGKGKGDRGGKGSRSISKSRGSKGGKGAKSGGHKTNRFTEKVSFDDCKSSGRCYCDASGQEGMTQTRQRRLWLHPHGQSQHLDSFATQVQSKAWPTAKQAASRKGVVRCSRIIISAQAATPPKARNRPGSIGSATDLFLLDASVLALFVTIYTNCALSDWQPIRVQWPNEEK